MFESEIISLIASDLQRAKIPKDKQSKIIDYISGNIDDIDIDVPKYVYNYVNIFKVIERELYTQNSEIVKRAFKIYTKMWPSTIVRYYSYDSVKYSVFSKAELDNEFVKYEIISSINNTVNNYYGNTVLYNMKMSFSDSLDNMEYGGDWSKMFYYYKDVIYDILDSDEKDNPKLDMAKFILYAMCIAWHRDDEQKRNMYIEITERNMYSLLKKAFNQADIIDKINELNLEHAKKLFNETPKSNIFYNNDFLKSIAIDISSLFYKMSPALKEAYKLCIIEHDKAKTMRLLDMSIESMVSEYDNVEMPLRYYIELYASCVFESEYFNQIRKLILVLKEYCEKYEKQFIQNYYECVKNNAPEAVILLSILIDRNALNTDEIKNAENIIISQLSKADSLSANKNQFKFMYNGQPSSNFEILKDSNFDCSKSNFLFGTNNVHLINTAICSAAIYKYSELAKNISTILMSSKFAYYWGNGISVITKISREVNSIDYNMFYEFSKKTSVVNVINAYIEYNGYDCIDEFKEFLKSNDNTIKSYLGSLNNQDANFVMRFIDIAISSEAIDYCNIVSLMEHKYKAVVSYIESILIEHIELRELIENMVKSKNKNAREAANNIIKTWNENDTINDIENAKTHEDIYNFVSKYYIPAKLPFSDSIDLSCVCFSDSEQKADEKIIKYYISEYMSLKEPRIISYCEKLREHLNEKDLNNITKQYYTIWLENGAEAKKKNILIPYAINCNSNEIHSIKRQIDSWAENSRGAIAAFAVKAMALNKNDIALLITDGISRKYKNKQVKSAAEEALLIAAEELNITKDELGDRIVPDLGFDKSHKRLLDYGSRSFVVLLNDKLEITLYDEKGKTIKSLPKPNSSDDTEKAEKAKEELKGLKKQLKTIVSTQKERLENAIMTGRKWTNKRWTKLFVDNPIMNCFATGLIWGDVDLEGNIINTFRYMDDGSFNTADEEEYFPDENNYIYLIHPLDIDKDTIDMWKSQLDDYEIVQPINQLSMPIYKLNDDEVSKECISRFKNINVYFGTIRGVMDKHGWQRTSICDGGGYNGYYYEDSVTNIGVRISFEYLYVGIMSNEEVKIGDIEFYKKGTVAYGGYIYDEIGNKNRVLPKDVPQKLMSFAIMVGDAIAQKEIK